jgi:hypothetical protein
MRLLGSTVMGLIVDIDDPLSWPREVAEMVENVVDRVSDSDWGEHPYEHLGWADFEVEELRIRAKLAGHRLVGYHATRLLAHEIASIRNTTGLEVLTDALRRRKVAEARHHYPDVFDDDDPGGGVLLRSGPNDWQGTADVRLGALDFAAPFTVFSHDARGFMNLLGTWGGETLGWLADGRGSSRLSERLTGLSVPAIVEFGARVPTLNLTPLLPAFAGRFGEVPGSYWHQWRTTESIPPEFVLDVITTTSTKWPPALAGYCS